MTDESLRVAFENALARSGRSGSDPRPNLYAVVTQDTQYDDLLHSSNNLAYSLGLRGLPIGFINGHAIEYTDTSEVGDLPHVPPKYLLVFQSYCQFQLLSSWRLAKPRAKWTNS